MTQGTVLIREDATYVVYQIYRRCPIKEDFVSVYRTTSMEAILEYLSQHPDVQYNQEDLPEILPYARHVGIDSQNLLPGPT